MTGVQLYPGIKYLPLEDEGGEFGLLIFHDKDNNIIRTQTIESEEMFKDTYARWVPQAQVYLSWEADEVAGLN